MIIPDPQITLEQQRAELCLELLNLEPLYVEPEIDPVDAARDSLHREGYAAKLRQLRRRLDEVDEALLRLARGEYGQCAWCGGGIDAARLEAYPAAALCIGYATRAEMEAEQDAA